MRPRKTAVVLFRRASAAWQKKKETVAVLEIVFASSSMIRQSTIIVLPSLGSSLTRATGRPRDCEMWADLLENASCWLEPLDMLFHVIPAGY